MAINTSQKGLIAQAGVTLIEMLVVVGIISIVSSVLMFNYSDFSTNVSVRNLAQEVALSIRKAQTYATSVRSIDGPGGSTSIFSAYGISFAVSDGSNQSGNGSGQNNDNNGDKTPKNSTNTPDNRRFVLFADIFTLPTEPSARIYNPGANDACGNPLSGSECIESFAINTADKIVSICKDTNATCFTNATADITFRRPSPDAILRIKIGNNLPPDYNASSIIINLKSAKGSTRSITVWNTGQISVQ